MELYVRVRVCTRVRVSIFARVSSLENDKTAD